MPSSREHVACHFSALSPQLKLNQWNVVPLICVLCRLRKLWSPPSFCLPSHFSSPPPSLGHAPCQVNSFPFTRWWICSAPPLVTSGVLSRFLLSKDFASGGFSLLLSSAWNSNSFITFIIFKSASASMALHHGASPRIRKSIVIFPSQRRFPSHDAYALASIAFPGFW